jgi:branched-chain amino acid aminotransferase
MAKATTADAPHLSAGRMQKIWRNGQFVNWEDATLHVLSHVVLYGSSVFEGVRCYEGPNGGAIFRAREHMRRLEDSCKIYRMKLEYGVDELVQAMVDTVAANDVRECYLRPMVMRTGQSMGVYGANQPIEVFVVPWKAGPYLGHDALMNGADVRVSSWRRAAPSTFPTMAKASGNYLNSQLSKMEAKVDEYAEGVLYTTPVSAAILHGITRDAIMTIARDLGLDVRETELPREMLYLADELFFTGTAAEVTPIRSVDRIDVGAGKPGPVTLRIQKEFLGIAKGKIPDRHGWLTPVPEPAVAGR